VTEEITQLRPEVLWFAMQMEAQLRANDHKPGWKEDSIGALMERLFEEAHELDQSLNPIQTIKEAADVANFAMMIADNTFRERILKP
jgi:hypothetical protein